MITALVEIDVQRGKVPETAERLVNVDGVSEVWSVTGEHDLIALLKLHQYEDLAEIVTHKIAAMPEILSTRTMLAFRVYSRQELEEAWNIGVD